MVAQALPYVDVSTGLDSSGNIQHKGGSLDANWTITGAVNPLHQPNAYVVAPGDADYDPSWISNGAYSSWIAANPFDAHGNGLITATRTFDVTTPSTATIIGGAWTIDDRGTLRLTAICFPRLQLMVLGLTSMRSLRPRATLSRDRTP
jgi:hypothetical protein